jgi:hypothetical protein
MVARKNGRDRHADAPKAMSKKFRIEMRGMTNRPLVSGFRRVPALTVLENVRIALQRSLGKSFHIWKRECELSIAVNCRLRAFFSVTRLFH